MIFGVVLVVLLVDLKRDITESVETANVTVRDANQTITTVNQRLPEIVDEVKIGTETLAGLAEDVELIKSLAGLDAEQADRGVRGLATYADAIQKVLGDLTEGQEVHVLKEKVIGKKLEVVEPVEAFLVGLSREMVTLVLFAKSKQEILERACTSGPPRRKPFFLKFPGEEPISMKAFIKQNHPESASLPEFDG